MEMVWVSPNSLRTSMARVSGTRAWVRRGRSRVVRAATESGRRAFMRAAYQDFFAGGLAGACAGVPAGAAAGAPAAANGPGSTQAGALSDGLVAFAPAVLK